MPLLILLPVLGAALILRRQLKLSDSLAILCAVSGILIGVYLGALTGFLQGTVYALTAIGVLLLLWEIQRNIKDKTLPFSFPLLLFLVLPVLYWLVHAESKPMFWDEYSHWGIYIRESAVLDLAGRIVARIPGGKTTDRRTIWEAIRSAVFCLYHHEAFHHYVESFAIRLELVEQEPRYLPYHQDVYRRPEGEEEPLEEGLACAEQFRRRAKESGLRGLSHEVHLATERLLKDWIPKLGPGYRQGVALYDDDAFHKVQNRLSSQIQSASSEPTDDGSRWRLIRDDAYKGLCKCRGATYLVTDWGSHFRVPGVWGF